MSGEAFARRVQEHVAATGGATSRLGVIHANPEQSKHLETATMRVNDLNIDFVHLRAEEYADASRIPRVVRDGRQAPPALRPSTLPPPAFLRSAWARRWRTPFGATSP
jgi:hypothetical protein